MSLIHVARNGNAGLILYMRMSDIPRRVVKFYQPRVFIKDRSRQIFAPCAGIFAASQCRDGQCYSQQDSES